MVTGDNGGHIKYWQSNMKNVKMFQAHQEAIRGIRYGIGQCVDSIHFFYTLFNTELIHNQYMIKNKHEKEYSKQFCF